MKALMVADAVIRQDANGRYCLNDLHRAAGGETKHTPGRFTITQQFKDLIFELSRNQDSPEPSTSAAGIGTFVAKELVYAYAMWISAAFHLKVIRAYDAMVTTPAIENGFAIPKTFTEALRLAADQSEQIETQKAQLAIAAPKVEFADAVMNSEGTTLVRDVAKTIGVGVRKLEKALRTKGVILSNNAPAAVYVQKGYFEEAIHSFETKTKGTRIGHTARVTGRGIEFIRRFASRHLNSVGAIQ